MTPNIFVESDKCANPYCNGQILENQFYCNWCKKRLKKSVIFRKFMRDYNAL